MSIIEYLFYGFYKVIIDHYTRLLEKTNKKYCQIGTGSRIYCLFGQKQIINLQKDPKKLLIGENTHIRGHIFIYPFGNGIKIGNNSYIGDNSIIRSAEYIEIGNSVLIAHNVTIIDTDSHEIDYKERNRSFINMVKYGHPINKGNVKTAPIIIHDNVWISYGVSILKGITIGQGAIIGAGSVVTKNVPAWTLVAGNPAIVIKKINE